MLGSSKVEFLETVLEGTIVLDDRKSHKHLPVV